MNVPGKKRSRFAKDTSTAAPSDSIENEDYMAPVDVFVSSNKITNVENITNLNPKVENKKQKLSSLMKDARDEALAVPIGSENIGFKLLKKFGFIEGSGLGVEGKGISVPLHIHDRSGFSSAGLGVFEKKERSKLYVQQYLAAKKEKLLSSQLNFRETIAAKHQAIHEQRDTFKAQKIIYNLDEKEGIAVHSLSEKVHDHFSSAEKVEEVNESKEENEETVVQLADCLQYLREVHFYCYYCGCGFESHEELSSCCPGISEDDH